MSRSKATRYRSRYNGPTTSDPVSVSHDNRLTNALCEAQWLKKKGKVCDLVGIATRHHVSLVDLRRAVHGLREEAA